MNSGPNVMITAIRRALGEILDSGHRPIVLGPDVGAYGGLFRATSGLYERFGAGRFVDVAANDLAALGLARGFAWAGHVPIVELAPESAGRAGGALADDLGHMRGRGRSGPFVVRVPVAADATPEALFEGVARVVTPSTPHDAWAMLRAASEADEPVVILEPRALYRDGGLPVPVDVDASFDPSVLRAPRLAFGADSDGADLVMVAWGAGVRVAVATAAALADDGYRVDVVDLRVLAPLDLSAVAERVAAAGRAVVVSEAGGALAGRVVAELQRAAFLALEAPIVDVATGAGADGVRAVAEATLFF